MAHKGKNYKVWFRRDCSLNVIPPHQGFPEAYILVVPALRGTTGEKLRGPWLVVNTSTTSIPFATWTSDWVTTTVGVFRAKVHIDLNPIVLQCPLTVQIERNTPMLYVEAQGKFGNSSWARSDLVLDLNSVLTVNGPGVSPVLGQEQNTAKAARYADYNP